MQNEPRIAFRNIDPSEAIESHVRRRIGELEKVYPRIVGCEVVIEAPQKKKVAGRSFKVHLKVEVPGPDIDVTRTVDHGEASENVAIAVHEAFDTAGRLLLERKREASGH
mgnify:CR=1 FL=1